MGRIRKKCAVAGCRELQMKKGMRSGKPTFSTLCEVHRKSRRNQNNETL